MQANFRTHTHINSATFKLTVTHTHINSATFKLTVILLKMTCATCRNVYNKKMLTIYGVSIVLCFIKILYGSRKVCLYCCTCMCIAVVYN